MKKYIEKKYSIITISSLVLIILLACVFFSQMHSKASGKTKTDYELINRNTFISTNKNGVLQIKRDLYTNEVPMSKEESWTIFLYVTGTNLESQYKSASTDFKEILQALHGTQKLDKLNIVIQTGGCSKWQSNNISSANIQRYVAKNNNKLELVDEQPLTSMGDPSTLYDFLKWGVKKYPAKHMGVVFWNHGSGVENGICQDPLFKGDPLTLNEIEYTFAKTTQHMTSRFDFVGFDTCLSGSLEYANILVPYAKYMVASSDLEPNNGWYYTPIVRAILNDPSIDGLDLCKVICDSYANSYKNDPPIYNTLTMCVYDLAQVDDVCIESNYLSKYMFDKLKSNPDYFFTFSNNLKNCIRYSDTTIDIGSLLTYFENSNDFDYNTYFYRKELNELIAYSHIGSEHTNKNGLGLTLYYPNSLLSLSDLENIRNAIFSPYWFQFIERMCYRRCHESMDGFNEQEWRTSEYFYENTFDFLNYRNHEIKSNGAMYSNLLKNHYYVADGFPYLWKNNFGSSNSKYNAPFIMLNLNDLTSLSMSRNESFDFNNTHISASMKITNSNYVSQVNNSIFAQDGDNLIFLGENNNLEYDSNNNVISTTFHPEWLCLPDGQYVACNIISTTESSTTYGIPVLIDGIPSTIRVVEEKDTNDTYHYNLIGVWDATNNTKHAGRSYLPLKFGSKITPIYDTYNLNTGEFSTTYGKDFYVSKDLNFLMSLLIDGNYCYSFNVEGINGINYITSLNPFTIEDSLLVK